MIDSKDERILEILKANSSLSTQQIARKTLIPVTTVHNRIKKLVRIGIIKGYTIILDHKKLGRQILAYILITVNYNVPGKRINQGDLAKEIKRFGCVEEVCIIAGVSDIIIKVRTKDVEELNDFVIDKLRSIAGVDKTQTMIVLSEI